MRTGEKNISINPKKPGEKATNEMTRRLYLFVIALFLVFSSVLPSTASDWAANYGELTDGSVETLATTADASGNVYLAGYFQGVQCRIDGVTLIGIGNHDVFVAKLDSMGNLLWAKNFGGSGANASGYSIAVDGSGNVYLGGYFSSANLTTPSLTKLGGYDAFAIKLDSSGGITWAKNFGGSGAGASGTSIAADGSGNVYLGGYFWAADLTTPALGLLGTRTAFAIKLDSGGGVTWAKNFGGSEAYAYGYSIAADGSGNVYLGGYFNNGNLITPSLTKIGNTDAFAIKLDASGDVLWAKNFGGWWAYAYGIAVDGSGNVYLGGYFNGDKLTSPALTKIGNTDAFAIKLDSGGGVTWAKNFGGSGAGAYGYSIAADGSGNVYLGGYFNGANLTSPALTKIGSSDAFAIKLDSGGGVTWAKNYGGSGAGAYGYSIAADGSGNVYLGGYFQNANLTTPVLTKIGSSDAFAIKLDSGGGVTWAKNFGGSGACAYGYSIAADGSGNVYWGGVSAAPT